MLPLYWPYGPYLVDTELLGFPIAIRLYGVCIVLGALLSGWIAARRAARRGYNPDDVWNLLMLGLVLGVLGARLYYVAFEWRQFAGQSLLFILNPANGGLAIHGALIGAVLAALIYTRWQKLPFVEWLDICLPTVLVAQAVGRWGNFFNQEAYGRPTTLPIGVRIDADRRVDPFRNMQEYPPNMLFHATFLYESIWNIGGFGLLMLLERRLRGWLRTGDMALMYAIWYGLGRFWIEGLRTDSLCTNGIGGACDGALRTAQLVSLLMVVGGLVGIFINHRFINHTPRPKADETPDETPKDEPDAAAAGANS
ncbi:MAG: prolipoprotein diacylglyceryl transferase [Roseiflexaceae bacterium]